MKQSILHDGVDSAMYICRADLRQIMPADFEAFTDAFSPRSGGIRTKKNPRALRLRGLKTEIARDLLVRLSID
jgi:hypothetical protein